VTPPIVLKVMIIRMRLK